MGLKSKIVVAHLISASSRISGGEKSVFCMLEKMPHEDVDLTVIFIIDGRGGPSKYIASEEAERRGLPSASVLSNYRFDVPLFYNIRKFIKRHHVDILHCHGYKADIYGYLASLNTKVKVISTLHGWLSGSLLMSLYEHIDYIFYKYFIDRIITVSLAYQHRIVEMGVSSEKVLTIPNAINQDDFRSSGNPMEFKNKLNIPPANKVVGIVGRLAREKAHEVFIESCSQIASRMSDVTFLIIGEGYRMNELKNMVTMRGLDQRVIFTGYQDNITSIYNALDIVVLTSITEGLPVSLLEASAMGKPIVSTDAGGASEIVINEMNGYIVPLNDSDAVTERIITILSNNDLALALGANGKKVIQERFTPEIVCEKTVQLYQDLLGRYNP